MPASPPSCGSAALPHLHRSEGWRAGQRSGTQTHIVNRYLSVDLDIENDKNDERDETMDDEVEVDEIVLHIVRLQAYWVCFYVKIDVFFVTCYINTAFFIFF